MKTIIIFFLYLFLAKSSFAQSTYTFTGDGNWSAASNWSNTTVPPNPLLSGSTIYISPASGHSCILNVSQTISQGANLIVTVGSSFIIQGGLIINNNLPTVIICTQTWMVSNLTVPTYRNGDPIPQVTDQSAWSSLTTGAWCYYNNDPATESTYGKLYNWYAVNDSRGLAPIGWHIPSDIEWTTLSNCLGGVGISGAAMKEIGITHWASPNTGATNSSGFTGLPSGNRTGSGLFHDVTFYEDFWSSTPSTSTLSWTRSLNYDDNTLSRYDDSNTNGYSVRCIKD